jgi:beta-lactamase regulating signal transducer with metallopeptidase domain
MSNEAALAFAGLWLTYLLRSAAAYMLLWLLCRFIQDHNLRFRLCGVFLVAMVAAWLGLLWQPSIPVPSGSDGVAVSSGSGLHWSWYINSEWAVRLATFLSRASWVYVVILSLLLLQFVNRLWQLKVLLRPSQLPSEALASLFESIRCGAGAPRCQLRLVHGLRSPAATAWWNPKVLLPSELVPRLEAQQLADILRHELMHVRRRDYLWDRLATLGCYVVFFHPGAWLVRRRLRWERELVCDAGSVEGSHERRLEYAACLTKLAGWRFLKELAGPVDFLTPAPSLLATRVRTLVSRRPEPYSVSRRAAVGLFSTATLSIAVLVMPEVKVTTSWSPLPTLLAIRGLPLGPQPIAKAGRARGPKRHRLPAHVTRPTLNSRLAPRSWVSPASATVPSAPPEAKNQRSLARDHKRWAFIPRVGAWAIRSVRFGVTKVESHISGHERKKEPLG